MKESRAEISGVWCEFHTAVYPESSVRWCLFRTATSSLTMENVPWHADVKAFAEALAMEKGGSEYELACEHAHSCCVLLAKTAKFKVDGKWHTWIDYEKFHDLVSVTVESVRQL